MGGFSRAPLIRRPISVQHPIDDLARLTGPLTEEAVFKFLKNRFNQGTYCTHLGPHLVVVSHQGVPTAGIEPAAGTEPVPAELQQKVSDLLTVVDQMKDVTFMLSGESGGGKTSTSRLLLRQLCSAGGCGEGSERFLCLSASLTALGVLGSVSAPNNPNATRIGRYIENVFISGRIEKTRLHCFFLDQNCLTETAPRSTSNYHIFYQMLAGLTTEERVLYHLEKCTPENLAYLSHGKCRIGKEELCRRFQSWKESLQLLGVCVPDILQVLAAVLLLGNIEPKEGVGMDVDIPAHHVLKAVSMLVGVSCVSLYQSLTTCTRKAGGEVFKASINATMTRQRRDALAQLLYARTTFAVLKRANSSLKHVGDLDPGRDPAKEVATAPTVAADWQDVTQSDDLGSSLASTINGLPKLPRETDLTASCQQLRYSGCVGVLDMFGSEKRKVNRLRDFCVNLASEMLDQFYVTNVFKAAQEELIEEGLISNSVTGFSDNTPIVELLSTQETSILHLLDAECQQRKADVDSYLQKVGDHHKDNPNFSESCSSCFAISHHHGDVEYDAGDFIASNQDRISDDLIWLFERNNCTSEFLQHLFSGETHKIKESGKQPRGDIFRIAPPNPFNSRTDHVTRSSLASEFRGQLADLLTWVEGSRLCFVHCIRASASGEPRMERDCVVAQIRALQILEMTHMISTVFPYRMPYDVFNREYHMFACWPRFEKHKELSKLILEKLEEGGRLGAVRRRGGWAVGDSRVLLSRLAWQRLGKLRTDTQNEAAVSIQKHWRRHQSQMRCQLVKAQQEMIKKSIQTDDRTEMNTVEIRQQIPHSNSSLHVLDANKAPKLPPRRMYVVRGNMKLAFPHMRLINQAYQTDDRNDTKLSPGTLVRITGPAARNGYLVAELGTSRFHLPHQITDLLRHPMMNTISVAV